MKISGITKFIQACLAITVLLAPGWGHGEGDAGSTQKVGLEKLDLLHKGGSSQFIARIEREVRCHFGDFDALAFDVIHSPTLPRLIFTVETLGSDEERKVLFLTEIPVVAFPTDLVEKGGHVIEALLSPPLKAAIGGIFICRDSEKSGQCQDKELMTIDEAIGQYRLEHKRPKDFEPSDKIYYFWPLKIGKEAITFPKTHEKALDFMKLADTARKVTEAGQFVKVSRGIEIFNTVGSLPPEILSDPAPGLLRLILPGFDTQKCTP